MKYNNYCAKSIEKPSQTGVGEFHGQVDRKKANK